MAGLEALAPDQAPVGGVPGREDPGDPEGEEPPVGERRCRLRALAVPGRRRVHLVGDGIGLLPPLSTAGEIERAHDLALTLARELVDAIPRDDRRGVPRADRDLPAGSERLGPAGSRREPVTCPSRFGPRHCGHSKAGAPRRPSARRGARMQARPSATRVSGSSGLRMGTRESYSERSDSSTGSRSTAEAATRDTTSADERHGREQQQHRGERRQGGAFGEAGSDGDERRARADQEAEQQQEGRLREHHDPDVAGAVADRAQQRELAPLLEGVADQDRPDPERAEQEPERARASGTWRCRCSRRGGTRRAARPPSSRRSRSPRGATRAPRPPPARARTGPRSGRSGSPRPPGSGLEVALARDQLRLQQARPQRRNHAHAHARVAECEALAEPAVEHVGERPGVGDHGDGAVVRVALEQQPGVGFLLGGLGQALLEREAALGQERGAGAITVGRSGR